MADRLKSMERDMLGMLVRETWLNYCNETGISKPSYLETWDELDAWQKEVDRRIGEAVVLHEHARIKKIIGLLNNVSYRDGYTLDNILSLLDATLSGDYSRLGRPPAPKVEPPKQRM